MLHCFAEILQYIEALLVLGVLLLVQRQQYGHWVFKEGFVEELVIIQPWKPT